MAIGPGLPGYPRDVDVIDLDLSGPWSAPDDAEPTQRHKGIGVFWLALLVLLALTGPPAAGGSMPQLWRADAVRGYFWLGDSGTYTAVHSGTALRLEARDTATGEVRWHREMTGTFAQSYRENGPLLAPSFPPAPGVRAFTRVLEAETGRQLGTYPVPGAPLVYFTDSVALIVDRDPAAAAAPNAPERRFDGWLEPHVATAVDLATGLTRWERRIEAGSTWVLPGVRPYLEGFLGSDGALQWMAVLAPTGQVELWDLATGAVRARGDVGPLDAWGYALALPDTLVVNINTDSAPTLTGYDPTTLARLWRVRVPEVPEASVWPVRCGRLVCLSSPYALWAVDPDQGRVVWHERVVDVTPSPTRLVPVLVVGGPTLIDVPAGRFVNLPGGWRAVSQQPREGLVVVSRYVDENHSRLGLLDLNSGAVSPLGDVRVTEAGGPCRSTRTHVVCADGASVRAWPVP